MTNDDKKKIYDILKKASSALKGYEDESFSNEPIFCELKPQTFYANKNEQNTYFTQSAPYVEQTTTLQNLAQKIANCKRCKLCTTRKNTVTGQGVQNPIVLVVGEAPGAEEDQSGLPFVGKAGELLDKMLFSIGLSRNTNCYIANIVKCRPPMNRDPLPEEADACSSFLQAQIHLLKPKIILAMGRVALQNLTKTKTGITVLHGKMLDYNGIPLMATYHPSAILRNADLKRPAWEDLKSFKAKLNEIS